MIMFVLCLAFVFVNSDGTFLLCTDTQTHMAICLGQSPAEICEVLRNRDDACIFNVILGQILSTAALHL